MIGETWKYERIKDAEEHFCATIYWPDKNYVENRYLRRTISLIRNAAVDTMRTMNFTPETINLPGNINDVYVTVFNNLDKRSIFSFMRGGVTATSDANSVTCKIVSDLLFRTYGISVRSMEATSADFPKFKITIKTDGKPINDVIVGIGRGPDPEVQVSGPDYETERLIYGLFAGNNGKASKGCFHYFSVK